MTLAFHMRSDEDCRYNSCLQRLSACKLCRLTLGMVLSILLGLMKHSCMGLVEAVRLKHMVQWAVHCREKCTRWYAHRRRLQERSCRDVMYLYGDGGL